MNNNRITSEHCVLTQYACLVSDSDCREPGQSIGYRKEPKNQPNQTLIFNFRPLRRYFEEAAATSTTSVINQWKALVKPELAPLPEFCHLLH
jgi:hypothetical protein